MMLAHSAQSTAALLRSAPFAPWGAVRRVAVPADARALSTLPRIDYEDAFLCEIDSTQDWTGEEWARAVLEDTPAVTRAALRRAWSALGLDLGSSRDERLVLGWQLRRSTPDAAILASRSRIGAGAEVLCARRADGLLVATFMQLEQLFARAVWAAVAPGHRWTVGYLLEELAARTSRGSARA